MRVVAPGPDYKLYLARHFVETKNAFIDIKHLSRRIGDVRRSTGSFSKFRQMSTSLHIDDHAIMPSRSDFRRRLICYSSEHAPIKAW